MPGVQALVSLHACMVNTEFRWLEYVLYQTHLPLKRNANASWTDTLEEGTETSTLGGDHVQVMVKFELRFALQYRVLCISL